MRPSRRLLSLLLVWTALGAVVFLLRLSVIGSPAEAELLTGSAPHSLAEKLWWSSAALLGLVIFFDAVRHRRFWKLNVVRELPHSLALGVHARVQLEIYNSYDFPVQLDVTDLYPDAVEADDLPISMVVDASSKKKVSYPVLPIVRGEARFRQTCLRVTTRWGLWQKRVFIGEPESVRVYPNFAPIARTASIGLEHQIAQMGIHLQQRRGEGSDFHQLREFREGDSLRQIDWNATSRHHKPISREYQDERDQEIVFLLDSGRRMRSKEDHISHFDHALNALLLTSYVALRQGDAVGLLSFAGERRWLSPVKGPGRINTILNQLYDLHSGTDTSDYLQVAEAFLGYRSKRSLVILITNVYEEDIEDLAAASRLLSRQHIVMVASLRDLYLDKQLEKPVNSFADSLSYCGTLEHMRRRTRVLARLHSTGTIVLDSLPHELHQKLVQEYFKLKRSGRL